MAVDVYLIQDKDTCWSGCLAGFLGLRVTVVIP